MSGLMDDPNRQAVGLEPAWVEGTGGSPETPEPTKAKSRTKAELLDDARARGIDVDDSMTKAELEEALEGS